MQGIVSLEELGPNAGFVKKISKVGFDQTPLYNIIPKGVPEVEEDTAFGHKWKYEEQDQADDDNAHLEGSAPADSTSNIPGKSINHYQTIKHTYGVTGAVDSEITNRQEKELARQGRIKLKTHKLTIEKLLYKDQTPVAPTKTVKGRAAGLLHFATVENTINAVGATLTLDLLRKLLKLGWAKGVPATHIICSDIQKDILDDVLQAKVLTKQGVSALNFTYYTEIKNLSYAPNVKIILSPFLASDKVLAVNMPSLMLVHKRLTRKYNLPRNRDAVEKEIITELTLRSDNPYAVNRLDDLGV